MGRVGDEHFRAVALSAALMIGADNHQSGKFSVGSSAGIEREFAQSSEGAELLLQVVIEMQQRLTSLSRLEGMLSGKCLKGCQFLVDDGIVFHRTAA